MVLSAVLHQTWSQSQQHVWYFGNQKIDFTQSQLHIENIPSMGNITPQFVSDGAHDEYGRMVMNIVDDKVYNKFGGLIDYLESDLYSTPENVIIPLSGINMQVHHFEHLQLQWRKYYYLFKCCRPCC